MKYYLIFTQKKKKKYYLIILWQKFTNWSDNVKKCDILNISVKENKY